MKSRCSLVVCCGLFVLGTFGASTSRSQERIDAASADLLDVTLIDEDHKMASNAVQQHDRNGDQVLDVKEMRQLRWLFEPSRFDLNRNDRLTPLEVAIHFANMRRQFGIESPDTFNAGRMINLYDRNGDRMLTESEAERFPIESKFSELDANRDRRVSVLELARQLAADRQDHGIDSRDHWDAILLLRRFDDSGDLRLDREEAARADWPTEPASFDTNKDQLLAASEIAAGFAKYKQETGIDRLNQTGATTVMRRYDKNRDGRLDQQEIEAGGYPKDPESFDANGDGFLTLFEFAARYAKNRTERGVEPEDLVAASKLIARYDRNKNGLIDLSELLEERADVGVLDADLFLQFDTDENDKMKRMEVAAYLAAQRKKKSK